MSFQKITVRPIHQGQPTLELLLEIPKSCPMCDTGNVSPPVSAFHMFDGTSYMFTVYAEYYCPKCNQLYLVDSYNIKTPSPANPLKIWGYSHNNYDNILEISDEISNISSEFPEIYSQALQSERKGLNQLTGIGLRKALEYLVKDYSIYKYPDKESEIRKATLANCINNYIDSERIKDLATACAWLGNDETHYERKHKDYNVEDIKMFLKALVAFVEYDILADKAKEFISSSHAKQQNVPDSQR